MSESQSLGLSRRWLEKQPIPEWDCGKQGHIFSVLTDLDKNPRLARCGECDREWAFPVVMEVRRIPGVES